MQVFVLTLGTRGDLELFLALGCALRARGHRVVVGTSPFHAPRVREVGLVCEAVGRSDRESLVSVLASLAAVPDRARRTRLYFERWLAPELAAFRARADALLAGAEYFVSNVKLVVQRGGRVVPGAAVTYDLPLSVSDLSRFAPRQAGDSMLNLVAFHRALVDPAGEWPADHLFTGFWETPSGPPVPLPAEVSEFLDDGRPPVVAALGSMVSFDAARFARDLGEALRLAGRRGIVVAGWSPLRGTPAGCDRLRFVEQAPYEELFPRAACVVHHGGTGTTAAVLRSGSPSIVLPQIACQEKLAGVLLEHGIATGVFDADALAPEPLAQAIERAATDDAVRTRARAWQRRILAQPGLDAAVDAIEAHAAAQGVAA